MATTSNYGITLVEQAQAQKEVTINQALQILDAFIGNQVVDKDLATPPGSPSAGTVYIVAASPTGAWAGKATQLAYFDQIWRFVVPQTGARVWVMDEAAHYRFDGTAWVIIAAGGGGGASWGAITGTLSSQTDLQAALDAISNNVDGGAANANYTSSITINGGNA